MAPSIICAVCSHIILIIYFVYLHSNTCNLFNVDLMLYSLSDFFLLIFVKDK